MSFYHEVPKTDYANYGFKVTQHEEYPACRWHHDVLYKHNTADFLIRHEAYEGGAQMENYFLFVIYGETFHVHNYWDRDTKLILTEHFLKENKINAETIEKYIQQAPSNVQHVIVKVRKNR